jgi:peptide/nickel transport system ATP-binding protein
MTELALQTLDVAKTYLVSGGAFRNRRQLKAVNGVSLNVAKGAVLGLVGESGCGKTTMAKLILGLETLTAGEIGWSVNRAAVKPPWPS